MIRKSTIIETAGQEWEAWKDSMLGEVVDKGIQENWIMKIKENRMGFRKPNYIYLNPSHLKDQNRSPQHGHREEPPVFSVVTQGISDRSDNGVRCGIEMPERGIAYFKIELLEKYITNKKIKNYKLPNIETLETGNISLKGLAVEKSGNILNEVRKNNQIEKTGQFKGHLLKTYNFTLNNRRAIIGHKVRMAWEISESKKTS